MAEVWREVGRLRRDMLERLDPRSARALSSVMVSEIAQRFPEGHAWIARAEIESGDVIIEVLFEEREILAIEAQK